VDVPSFVFARPRAASALAEARLVGVGFMHHPALIDMPQLAEPQAQLGTRIDRSGFGDIIVSHLAQQATTTHRAHDAFVHPLRKLAKLARRRRTDRREDGCGRIVVRAENTVGRD